MGYRIHSMLCLYLLFYTGGKCIKVVTSVGKVAVLPCDVGAMDPAHTFMWCKGECDLNQYVYMQRNKEEDVEAELNAYRGRTFINQDAVPKGNLSLTFSSVTTSDDGNYTCFVPKLKKLKKQFNIQLIVNDHESTKAPNDRSPIHNSHEVTTKDFPRWAWVIIAVVIVVVGPGRV